MLNKVVPCKILYYSINEINISNIFVKKLKLTSSLCNLTSAWSEIKPELKYQGYDNVLPGQSARTPQYDAV
jgi:hypothetical protein